MIRVPLALPLDAALIDEEERARRPRSRRRALLGEDNGVDVRHETVKARAIGQRSSRRRRRAAST